MKKPVLCISLFFLVFPLFSIDFALTDLEKQIIKAGPGEMTVMVRNRGLEKQLLEIFVRYEDESVELDDLYPVFQREQPNATETDLQFMIFKIGLVSALGSGSLDTVLEGVEYLNFLKEFDGFLKMAESEGLDTEEFNAIKNSKFWKDCINFANSFESEAFIAQRFPEY
jgi:hypothetical protein